MTSRDFAYWLQGYFEIAMAGLQPGDMMTLNATQVHMIERHLALVFKHEIDPSQGSIEHQGELQKIHDGPVRPPWADPYDPNVIYRC